MPAHEPAGGIAHPLLDASLLEIAQPQLAHAERGVRVGLGRAVVVGGAWPADLDDEVGSLELRPGAVEALPW